MATSDAIEQANRRARATLKKSPHAVSARMSRGMIRVRLSNGSEFAFPPELAEGLSGADAGSVAEIQISPSGLGLHFPALDVDLYLPALLEGVFGSKRWSAAQLGKAGGASRSEAKAAAARENGKHGGRPRKEPAHA